MITAVLLSWMVMACTTSFVQLMMLVVTPSRSQKRVSSECETRIDSQGTLCSENVFIWFIITHSFLSSHLAYFFFLFFFTSPIASNKLSFQENDQKYWGWGGLTLCNRPIGFSLPQSFSLSHRCTHAVLNMQFPIIHKKRKGKSRSLFPALFNVG